MPTVCGWDLQLDVDRVICETEGCFLGAATDPDGQTWLVLHRRAPDCVAWLCGEVSSRMLEELEAGRAAPRDVLRHTLTGTVEIVTAAGGSEDGRDRCVCCADLPDSFFPVIPPDGRPVLTRAACAPPGPRAPISRCYRMASPARRSGLRAAE
jgi:hypothetical protein